MNVVTMSKQMSCPSSTSTTALLITECVVRFSKYGISERREGNRVALFAVVVSLGDEVPAQNRVAQRRTFGQSSRINLTTRKSSVEKVKNAEIGAKISGIEFASCVLMAV